MPHPRLRVPVSLVLAAGLLAGCAAPSESPSAAPSEAAASDGHGAVEGAAEVAEPQLHLVTVAPNGAVGSIDLLSEERRDIGSIGTPTNVVTDGRYAFATTEAGVEIVDSGMWTWDHVDHFHYYRGTPSVLGTVPGSGEAVIVTSNSSTTGSAGVFFPETGEAVLLDVEALARGEVRESFRLELAPHRGLVAPLGDGGVVTVPDDSGRVTAVRHHSSDGAPGETAECLDAAGAITTRVGLVIGCTDGALLVTGEGGSPLFERIPYPAGATAPAATSFANREGRPTVAGLAGDAGVWLLDTRERSWSLVPTATRLVAASTADDEAGHLVVLDTEGRLRVLDETGAELALTEPVVAGAPLDAGSPRAAHLTVDAERAYVTSPTDGIVSEIAYADGARVARTFEIPVGAFAVEVGR
ncbi:ABC transporter [Microbacterium sp. Marseille-Q6965]|uniref:ABC transporter n=1 Tax=Microbacterium sp. Marseille-Q6965 TaxID=2965072 RepID=UPI0021B7E9AC|nr:ABC transporter [Microbacterium sp. Marseille-Q6965]